jgi:SNF2 family DNA or RNA helicase
MIWTPRPYQRLALAHTLNNPRAALWMGMGLGKTGVTLEAISVLHSLSEVKQVLVIAPLRVARSTWPNEVAKWENFQHLGAVPIVGTPAQRKQAVQTKAIVHTINYENLPWLVKAWGDRWPYDCVIPDESTKLKGFRLGGGKGQRARALGKVAHSKVNHWSNLTGTPSPNGLADLWGQTWFLDKGARLGRTYTGFTERWFRQGYNGYGLEALPHAEKEIHEKLSDLCLSMEAKDHFDLPELVLNTLHVDLPPAARKLYTDMEREMFMELRGEGVEAFNAASRTMKCLQLASGAAYLSEGGWAHVHDAKLDALEDIIEEAAGAPVLVAYHFKSDLARILKRFPKARHLDADPQTEVDWNEGRIPILCAHPASAGHGLNLQHGGNILVFFAHWWDLEQYQQIIERIGPTRQAQSGYDRPVFVHHIVAKNTVDELVMARREDKRDVQDLLIEAMKRR